jgi:hypothetical protein
VRLAPRARVKAAVINIVKDAGSDEGRFCMHLSMILKNEEDEVQLLTDI